MVNLLTLFNASLNLNKWLIDNDNIQSNLDIGLDTPTYYYIFYYLIIFLFGNLTSYFSIKYLLSNNEKYILDSNIIQLIQSYSIIDYFFDYFIYFLVSLFIIFISFRFIKLFFKSDIKFVDYFKVHIFIWLPTSLVFIFLKLNNLLLIVIIIFNQDLVIIGLLISFIKWVFGFILLYFSLRFIVSLIRILSGGFKTTFFKLLGIYFIWSIILLIIFSLIILPMGIKYPMTSQMKILHEIKYSNSEEIINNNHSININELDNNNLINKNIVKILDSFRYYQSNTNIKNKFI